MQVKHSIIFSPFSIIYYIEAFGQKIAGSSRAQYVLYVKSIINASMVGLHTCTIILFAWYSDTVIVNEGIMFIITFLASETVSWAAMSICRTAMKWFFFLIKHILNSDVWQQWVKASCLNFSLYRQQLVNSLNVIYML